MLQPCSAFHRAKLTEPNECPIARGSGCHILGCNSKPATTENLDHLQLTSLTGTKYVFFDWNQLVQGATAEHQVMAMRSRDQPKGFRPGQNIYFTLARASTLEPRAFGNKHRFSALMKQHVQGYLMCLSVQIQADVAGRPGFGNLILLSFT